MIHLQHLGKFERVEKELKEISDLETHGVFYKMLLDKFSKGSGSSNGTQYEIDSKFVVFVGNFLKSDNKLLLTSADVIATDFVKYFDKRWINTKSGKTLLEIFVSGGFDNQIKEKFFDENMNVFFSVKRWNGFKQFIRKVLTCTHGHTKKKAGDILRRIESE